ncbi:ATP-binding cassette domain-containing protein [Lujinxingia sediminis]|uniref:ATP-binding cassette domain-containing protein n=1 Tax=Lujinxingia sediminis TaxID=2480984 RepID=A0ABY0CW87_9DELT|nr:ABC transporter ATP-binding protein [Lujinxingia sediminis]RVU48142.1 ATP-binding cassette domain-containing protein [Lujinxingia sediminis]
MSSSTDPAASPRSPLHSSPTGRDVAAPEGATVTWRRFVGLAKPHWRPLALATLALVIGSGITLAYPQVGRVVVDEVLSDGASYDLSTVGAALLGLFLIQAIFFSLRYYLFTVVGDRVVADLRTSLYEAIIGREMAFFDRTRTGELTSRLASDTQLLQSVVTTNLSMALRYGVQALGGLVLLFVTNVRLSLAMLVVLPVVMGAAMVYGRRVRRLSREVQDAIADSTSIAEESIAGVRTVRSFGRVANERARYSEAIERSFDLAKSRAVLGGIFGGGVTFLAYATIALIVWVGGHLVLSNAMSAGELTAYILYVLFVAVSLGVLSGLWTDFARALGAGERVFGLLDAAAMNRGRVTSANVREDAIITRGHVHFHRISFTYPTRLDSPVLQNIDFEVRPGQKLAIVGASGAGKSTIANLLSGFYQPDEGEIRVDGSPLNDFPEDALRAGIGMVAQEPVLFSGTVRDNVRYGRPDADEQAVRDALQAANALDFVEGFPEGLDTVVGERGVRLSGGQKQRVAIARALLKDPRVLILDEATSALDVESEALVQEALDRLMEGRTTLIIAHRLSTVARADHMVVLDRGNLVEAGSPSELVEQGGVYARMVQMQAIKDSASDTTTW